MHSSAIGGDCSGENSFMIDWGFNPIPYNTSKYEELQRFYETPKVRRKTQEIMVSLRNALQDPHRHNSINSDITAFDIPYLPHRTNDKAGVLLQNLCHHDVSRYIRDKANNYTITPKGIIYVNDKLKFAQRLLLQTVWDYSDQTNGFTEADIKKSYRQRYMITPLKQHAPTLSYNKSQHIVLHKPEDYNTLMSILTDTMRPDGTEKHKYIRDTHLHYLCQLYVTIESQTPELQNKEKIFNHAIRNIIRGISPDDILVKKREKEFKFFVDQDITITLPTGRKIIAHINAHPKESSSQRKKLLSKSKYDSSAIVGDNLRAEIIFQRNHDFIEYFIAYFNNIENNDIYLNPEHEFSQEIIEEHHSLLSQYKLRIKNKKFTKDDLTYITDFPESEGKERFVASIQTSDKGGRVDAKYTDRKIEVPIKVMGTMMKIEIKGMTGSDHIHSGYTRHTHYNTKRLLEILCRRLPEHGIPERTMRTVVRNSLKQDPALIQEVGNDNIKIAEDNLIQDIKKAYYALILKNSHTQQREKIYVHKQYIHLYIKHGLFPHICETFDKNLQHLKSDEDKKIYHVCDVC